jgi:sRNA-binding regulator protein Hfq
LRRIFLNRWIGKRERRYIFPAFVGPLAWIAMAIAPGLMADTIYFRNGDILECRITGQDVYLVYVDYESKKRKIPKSDIARIVFQSINKKVVPKKPIPEGRRQERVVTEKSNPYPVGGMVSGLVKGESITILNNAGDSLIINENGGFVFATPTASFEVTIKTQPEHLRCIVQNGTGIAKADVTDIIITCPMTFENRLIWMRCTHGQQWDIPTGECTGTGNKSNNYGARPVQFCSNNDNSCNGNLSGEALSAPLRGRTSSLWEACKSLNEGSGTYGIKGWRVPTKRELQGIVHCSNGTKTPLVEDATCGSRYAKPTINQKIFINTVTGIYWSSETYAADTPVAYGVSFSGGNVTTNSRTQLRYVRCVARP